MESREGSLFEAWGFSHTLNKLLGSVFCVHLSVGELTPTTYVCVGSCEGVCGRVEGQMCIAERKKTEQASQATRGSCHNSSDMRQRLCGIE